MMKCIILETDGIVSNSYYSRSGNGGEKNFFRVKCPQEMVSSETQSQVRGCGIDC